MDERRHLDRVPVTIAVELDTGAEKFWGKAVNLSEGGIGVLTDEPLVAGSEVALTLYLWENNGEPDQTRPLQLEGRVAWFRMPHGGGNLAGVQFSGLDQARKVALQLYIERFRV